MDEDLKYVIKRCPDCESALEDGVSSPLTKQCGITSYFCLVCSNEYYDPGNGNLYTMAQLERYRLERGE